MTCSCAPSLITGKSYLPHSLAMGERPIQVISAELVGIAAIWTNGLTAGLDVHKATGGIADN
ncbi:hypothetical protein [uncultured Endozoicomonas sp.]|uniref:hypothetical protein n=1 Tax=uncultured Endozoicomonas sp. TaxID=432652 RepID=UPI002629455D|nr:hypothetical protein [uncultured Endozoicomonas sp.]